MNKKGAIILEYVWLVLAIFAALYGIYKSSRQGLNESYMFFIISAIAAFMYMLRKAMRKFKENDKK